MYGVGMAAAGRKHILGFCMMDAEETASRKVLLVELKALTPTGKRLRLITVDDL
ncbi:MAG: hypothetical protein P8Z30_04780 [Acidobacteriota bacterium]